MVILDFSSALILNIPLGISLLYTSLIIYLINMNIKGLRAVGLGLCSPAKNVKPLSIMKWNAEFIL